VTRARIGGKSQAMRTRLSICRKKARYASRIEAQAGAERIGLPLLPYRFDRCRLFHLTSRTRGKFARGLNRSSGSAEPD
jgi:hypothetical protein